MKLLVALGNPGDQYVRTRHNAGFLLLDRLAESWGAAPWQLQKEYKSLVTTVQHQGEKCWLMKPLTYMNKSGEAVAPFMRYYDMDPADVLVLYDDVDIPLGRLRFRELGSAGTHNGMRSVLQQVASGEVARLRIGIGHNGGFPGALHDYVLGRFSEEELAILYQGEDTVRACVDLWLKGDIAEAKECCSIYRGDLS